MRMRSLAIGLMLLPLGAAAQDRPVLFPTRDVAITYRASGGGGGQQTITMAWLAAAQSMRMDMPGMGWMVADHRSQRGFMVMEQQRMVMDLPMEQAMRQYGPGPSARFTREGTDRVAGVPCTIWRFEEGQNRGRACLTQDGALLRGEGGGPQGEGRIEATSVQYAPQDPARFARPQGYQTMQMPQGMPPGAMMPGRPQR